MHFIEGIGSNNLAAQYRRKHWVRWLWFRVEPVVSVFAVGVLAIGYLAVRVVVPFIAGMAFMLWLAGFFIR